MLNEILQKLNENPDAIVELLDYYECGKIKVNTREVRFARDDRPESGLNISIRLENNDACLVKDFAHSEVNNIISWLCKEKNADFKSVLLTVKRILNLSDDWRPPSKQYKLFAGIYDSIINKKPPMIKTYSDDILKRYIPIGNKLWLSEGISLSAQRFYDVSFDIENNGIIFPWRNDRHEIIAIKSRYNGITPEGVSKYYYPIGGNISSSLFNYSHCYEHLYNNDIFLFEAEKSCMIGWSRGIKNTLAIGSHSLSPDQCKLILQLQPKTVYFMLDSDLDLLETKKNADLLKSYAAMRETSIKFWDWRDSLEVGEKSSPIDGTIDSWNYILKNEIKDISELEKESIKDKI